jgi:hypothetical protein
MKLMKAHKMCDCCGEDNRSETSDMCPACQKSMMYCHDCQQYVSMASHPQAECPEIATRAANLL